MRRLDEFLLQFVCLRFPCVDAICSAFVPKSFVKMICHFCSSQDFAGSINLFCNLELKENVGSKGLWIIIELITHGRCSMILKLIKMVMNLNFITSILINKIKHKIYKLFVLNFKFEKLLFI
jgi:hypothetical protein